MKKGKGEPAAYPLQIPDDTVFQMQIFRGVKKTWVLNPKG
jgi:hypothetical protein